MMPIAIDQTTAGQYITAKAAGTPTMCAKIVAPVYAATVGRQGAILAQSVVDSR